MFSGDKQYPCLEVRAYYEPPKPPQTKFNCFWVARRRLVPGGPGTSQAGYQACDPTTNVKLVTSLVTSLVFLQCGGWLRSRPRPRPRIVVMDVFSRGQCARS